MKSIDNRNLIRPSLARCHWRSLRSVLSNCDCLWMWSATV